MEICLLEVCQHQVVKGASAVRVGAMRSGQGGDERVRRDDDVR